MSQKKAYSISLILFFIGLAYIAYYGVWWPGILLVIGIPLAFKHLLMKRYHDCVIAVVVFGGIYIASQYGTSAKVLLPILFLVIALYILLKDLLGLKPKK